MHCRAVATKTGEYVKRMRTAVVRLDRRRNRVTGDVRAERSDETAHRDHISRVSNRECLDAEDAACNRRRYMLLGEQLTLVHDLRSSGHIVASAQLQDALGEP